MIKIKIVKGVSIVLDIHCSYLSVLETVQNIQLSYRENKQARILNMALCFSCHLMLEAATCLAKDTFFDAAS